MADPLTVQGLAMRRALEGERPLGSSSRTSPRVSPGGCMTLDGTRSEAPCPHRLVRDMVVFT